jgi:hypothetical protein
MGPVALREPTWRWKRLPVRVERCSSFPLELPT